MSKKINLTTLARDLNISPDDIIHMFRAKGDYSKTALSALTAEEANWLLEKITQDNMVENFDDFFATCSSPNSRIGQSAYPRKGQIAIMEGDIMDNGTIKEICDVVTGDIMKQVRSNLSDMKPELLRTVTETATRKAVEAATQAVDARCRTLEQRIAQLEATISKLSATPPTPAQPKAERIPARAVDGITTLSATQIDDILSFPNFCRESNGWIYYIKIAGEGYRGYGELFKVRPDGTQNQRIFNGKVSNHEADARFVFSVSGDRLTFRDADHRVRVIRV